MLTATGMLSCVRCFGLVHDRCRPIPACWFAAFASDSSLSHPPGLLQEILPAMKLVKYYAWERFFEKRVRLPLPLLCYWPSLAAAFHLCACYAGIQSCCPFLSAFL
jgi:hypothetical protein